MERLYESQQEISEALNKLKINIKKDGAERKTDDYFRRRSELLESYWEDYQNNHIRICASGVSEHRYFLNSEHEQTSQLYTSIKTLIAEQCVGLAATIPPSPHKRSQSKQEDRQQEQAERVPGTSKVMMSKGSTSKLDDMVRKQTANIKAFKRAITNIDLEDLNEKWELEDALRTLQSKWKQVDELHWEIDGELCGADEEYDIIYSNNEKTFISLKRAINKKLWSVSYREHSTPQMDIPIFTGKYHQWYSFKDLFNETIHSNRSMSAAQKMQFLKGKLRGEAEKIIQHLPISSENYNTSWELLNHRYNNKKLIFNSIVNTLLGLPNMQQQSWTQIKKLHDVTLESIHGIKNLGVDINTWDPLLVNLLSQKLDQETFGDYIDSLKNARDLPVLQEFLNFLESKFTSLESSRRKHESFTQKANQDTRTSVNKNHQTGYNNQHSNSSKSFSKALHVSMPYKCPLCGHQHGLYNCKRFLESTGENKLKTVSQLKVCINCLFDHNGKQCTSTKRCRNCNGMHNSIMHDACTKSRSLTTNSAAIINQQQINENPIVSVSSHVTGDTLTTHEVMLATTLIKVQAIDGSHQVLRALIDPGSQVSLIREEAVKKLGLQKLRCKGIVMGIGEQHNKCKGKLTIHCSSIHNNFSFSTDVLIMDNLLGNLPIKTFDRANWCHIENLKLADPEFNSSRPVDLLLNANVHGIILLSGLIRGESPSHPVIQQTQLGWIIYGGGEETTSYRCNVVLSNTQDIQRFWEIEDISEESQVSSEDQECIDYYLATTKRLADGRYEVRLPLKSNTEGKLGSSKEMAIAQFQNLERKFQKQPNLAEQYKLFIYEYQALGHMFPRKNNNNNTTISCYLPHHAVQRAESTTTKLRVVFNASARTSSGNSVNDLMFKGPNLQQDLQKLIIKWRQYRYAYTADIEKMYRQIMVNEADRRYQQIVWRDSPHKTIETYQLATVTYGTKSAPFLAMMTLRQLAKDEEHKYPEASKVLTDSFYVDDLIHGSHSIQDGKQLITDLNNLLRSGGFQLRKWSANSSELLANIDNNQSEGEIIFNFKTENPSKTLGLRWNATDDQFTFKHNSAKHNTTLTKRMLLAEISKLFDPLGWISPVTTKLKILFQKLWINNLDWDEEVPENIKNEWNTLQTDIVNINEYKIPRWIGYQPHDTVELHGYCDASTKAYAAVIYARIKKHNKSSVVLVVAKSRLVPVSKSVTLPKLELSGAHLLGKLMNKVISCLGDQKSQIFGWTDSMVVLGWLQGDPGRWKPFVANRTKSITEVIKPDCWRYVKSEENPADAASRGILPSQLKHHSLWWQGPNTLKTFDANLELSKPILFTTDQELKTKHSQSHKTNALITQHQNTNTESIISKLLDKYSSFTKTVKVLAWLLRATKTMQLHNNITSMKHGSLPSYLTLLEIRNAKSLIVKHVQRTVFSEEIEHLKKHGKLNNKSNLLKLDPFIDREGILRVGGRLRKADIGMEMKHPAILPNKSRLTTLVINQAHLLTYHGGPRLTLANIRQKYWIIGGNSAVKKEVRNCVLCRKHSPRMQHQLMGDLPESRSKPAPPFYHTGVDYTGYVEIKSNKGRGIKTTKGYIALFVCMATRAVHLELVSDLSSSAFLAALQRMAARRGAPRHIYSDNGTNFVGANRVLQEQFHDLQSMFDNNLSAELTDLQIQWHFNAPSWPSAGGLWERAVRSLKHHLKRVVGEQKLTFEEYTTVLAKLESCMNSRPLCALSENIDDLEVLTPAHFLTGRPGTSIIETEHDARTRWTLSAKIAHDIWKRWKTEYLAQQSMRPKWMNIKNNIEIGQLVTIQDDNLPPGKWMMGRVIELHPGQDGLVRVVTIKTKNGVLKRPIVKLSILPISSHKQEDMKNDQDSNKNGVGETKVKTNKPKSLFTSMALSLIIFMSLITTSQTTEFISPLSNNISLYFDSINNMQLIRDKWTLIVYYNMTPYWDGMTTATKFLDYLDKTCSTLTETSRCGMLLLQLHHEYSELQHYNRLLLNQHFDAHDRQRRGLINGIGNIANALFGVLDESFAEQYKKDIQLITQNEHHLTNLLKNQTSIVEAEYNVLKRTEQHIQRQHKTINKHLNELDRATNTIKENMDKLSDSQDFTLSAVTAVNLLHSLKEIQNTLLDTITDVYHGKFNTHLLTPDQLRNELQFISGQLNKDVTIPVDNIQSDLRSVYSMLSAKARVMTDYVIFEITFPLVSRDSYKIYKILSVPHQIGTNMLNVLPITDYVAINLKRDAYLTISFTELQLCQHNENSYLCTIDKPVNYLPIDEKFCKVNHNINQCVVSKSQCSDMWIELNDPSKYLYFCCNTYPIRIICQDQVTYKQISGAGIISLKPKCIIKGKDFALYSRSHSGNIIKTDPEIETPQITEFHHLVNISLSDYTESIDPLNQTLESIGQQINQLKTATANTSIEIDRNHLSLSTHDVHQYAICYGLLCASIVAAAVFLWRRRKTATRNLTQTEPTVKFSRNINLNSSEVNQVKLPRKQSIGADRQPSEVNVIASNVSLKTVHDQATSPRPQRRNFYTGDDTV